MKDGREGSRTSFYEFVSRMKKKDPPSEEITPPHDGTCALGVLTNRDLIGEIMKYQSGCKLPQRLRYEANGSDYDYATLEQMDSSSLTNIQRTVYVQYLLDLDIPEDDLENQKRRYGLLNKFVTFRGLNFYRERLLHVSNDNLLLFVAREGLELDDRCILRLFDIGDESFMNPVITWNNPNRIHRIFIQGESCDSLSGTNNVKIMKRIWRRSINAEEPRIRDNGFGRITRVPLKETYLREPYRKRIFQHYGTNVIIEYMNILYKQDTHVNAIVLRNLVKLSPRHYQNILTEAIDTLWRREPRGVRGPNALDRMNKVLNELPSFL